MKPEDNCEKTGIPGLPGQLASLDMRTILYSIKILNFITSRWVINTDVQSRIKNCVIQSGISDYLAFLSQVLGILTQMYGKCCQINFRLNRKISAQNINAFVRASG